ncbi:LOW QUALITY PROTEIN: hypothetical protein FGSG_12885 [Fusarium graminearum PH-1]|uniref:hypothetical protein n=1 Tax=Gibberella zeae (strain ATCC MYA-4620 / CBS 123657 / FGSC 9075 / NRRL 31084 / PH-1) TaxID=229533 RepID=UPI00021F14BC|nr:LOW QUALITY PROTEIN: hypothetical protein FGSG_12885 [Fusarium graminearum PH-1]ESU12243.1 LOW QUALITY PROTEIN: hypothetical protein FGSG_12885 [Fusarium graminearum PH-1]|eukprot:XP_011324819.1 LOW QUALITY PROTEIN: hypothetical protein FGSG_12885 [Fusarium graminearum PH-1]
MYFIITTSRASEIFYQAVTAVPVVTQRKYSNASAVKLPSFDHTASPHTTGPSSGVCVTCPRASKGVDSRVVPCKPASHQEPGTGSATRDSSLNINSSWDLRVCRMERCRLLKGNKACYSLNSYIATSRTPALHKGAGILVVVGGVTSLDSCPYPHLVKQQILAESTIGSLHNMSGQRLVLGLSATHEFCKVPRACHDSMFNTTYNGISMVPDEAYQYDHIYVHNPWAQYFSIKPDGHFLFRTNRSALGNFKVFFIGGSLLEFASVRRKAAVAFRVDDARTLQKNIALIFDNMTLFLDFYG